MNRLVPALILVVAPLAARGLDSNPWQRAVLTEVMVAPEGVPAGSGQWIEVRNLSDQPVNLQGMVLSTRSGGFHVISPAEARVLAPGGILTMGRLADPAGNGGATVGYSYGGDVLLSPETDVVMLLQEGQPVDFMSYGDGAIPVEPGRSLSLETPEALGKLAKRWCYGRTPYGALGNLGTPDRANDDCDDDDDGAAEDQGDCDDANPAVFPGAPEVCNGLDDDCSGETDDGLVSPPGACPGGGVCDEAVAACGGAAGWTCAFPAAWEASETRCDALDNDCDGDTDEGIALSGAALGGTCPGEGACPDGVVVCSPGSALPVCSTLPGGTDPRDAPEVCNGVDDDCDGDTDEGFVLGSTCRAGTGACARDGRLACSTDHLGTGCDAVPGEPGVELCGDSVDNDCDGRTDEDFDVGKVCQVGQGVCVAVGKYRCSEDRAGVACQAVPRTPGDEACDNGLDDDCDGTVDEAECLAPGSGGCAAGSGGSPWWWVFVLVALCCCRARACSRLRD